MKSSEKIEEVAKAMHLCQASLKKASKDSTNPYFNSKYADLASIWAACEYALTENNLSVLQGYGLEPVPHIWTMLLHTSGQWIGGECPLVVGKQNDPQALGSATTYSRRYALAAMLGIVQEDDDAQGAMAPKEGAKALGGPDAKKASVAALNEIKSYLDSGLVNDSWWTEKKKVYKVTKAQDLDEKQAKEILDTLKKIEADTIGGK